jgi:hypothetical protein
MECPICTCETEIVSVSTRCLHGTCKDCAQKLSDKPCYYCRDPTGAARVELNSDDYEAFLAADGPPRVDPFDVLFTAKYRATYETFRTIISGRWEAAATHTFSSVCGPCLLSQSAPEVDTTLLTLFYACSPITRTTVLDAMTCLSMLYGLRRCTNLLTPIGTYFHFFMNHCTTVRGVAEDDQSAVCDFVTKIMHALVYDVPEVDALSNFITTNLTSEACATCPCNESQRALDTISGRNDGTSTSSSSSSKDVDDEEGLFPFVPDDAGGQLNEPVIWANSYKWSPQGGKEEDEAEDDAAVNFFSAFTDCPICDEMMDNAANERLRDMDRDITFKRKFMNVATAVSVVCSPMGKTYTDSMIKHYTEPACELNRLKFIHFYSLVKQPHSLTGNSGAPAHLLSEIFSSKLSHVCPTYHLACFSHQIVSADESQLKKTKRDSIQKWSHKILKRHTR